MRALPVHRTRALLLLAFAAGVALLLATPHPAHSAGPAPKMAPLGRTPTTLHSYLGSMHEHSAYSDGYPGTNPGFYYKSGKGFGLDFMMGSDHSDTFNAPVVASDYCVGADLPSCVGGDPQSETDPLDKWAATARHAATWSSASYTAVRGFEWTSDRYGHINVYFSKNFANAKTDGGGYVTMPLFYKWFTTRPEDNGGSGGLATFNHPGAKDLQGAPQPGDLNWNDFAYDAASDDRMVGLELYNGGNEYGIKGPHAPPEGYLSHVLDKGWHVAPVGAEDLGHIRGDDWGGPHWAKTVMLATANTPEALRAAMLARRFYAVANPAIRLTYTVDRQVMGSRLARRPGTPLAVAATATWPGHVGLRLELVTTRGVVVATGTDRLRLARPAHATEAYYFVRVMAGKDAIAYSAPVWVTATLPTAVGEWLAGDLHVHTCASHDVYCGPGDSNTGTEDFYTYGSTVAERFQEAAVRGLDYLAITDHHSDDSPQDSGAGSINEAGFGSDGVIGVPGMENSIAGHAQMLGATHVISAGKKQAADINRLMARLHAEGGLLQANHPASDIPHRMTGCADTKDLHWKYAYGVHVDSLETWNGEQWFQSPGPATPNEDSITYWQCMLDLGWHVTATGGSDSHWKSSGAVQGIGNPTTWVFARERSARGILQAIREGRTSISSLPPDLGGAALLLEADRDRDGVYESMVGDTVPGGTPMRVRSASALATGLVEVRANDQVVVNGALLAPGGEVDFTAPAAKGWVWARLLVPDGFETRATTCDPLVGDQTSYCRQPVGLLGMTSAIYLSR